jgi:flagellar biogenesis protein FliO
MSRPRPVLLCLLTLLGLALVLARPAAAQDAPGATRGQQAEAQRQLPDWDSEVPAIPWKRLAYGTAAVVALICIGVYALKKLSGGRLGGGRYIRVMEARPLGRNVQLFVVKVGGRVLVLAYGGETVSRVAELTEEELPESQASEGLAAQGGFGALLSRIAGEAR